MILICLYNDGFIVNGHANYSDYGSDIVCSCVSAISFGIANYYPKELCQYFYSDNEKGLLIFKGNKNYKTDLLNIFEHQISLIEKSYQEYLCLVKYKTDLNLDFRSYFEND